VNGNNNDTEHNVNKNSPEVNYENINYEEENGDDNISFESRSARRSIHYHQ